MSGNARIHVHVLAFCAAGTTKIPTAHMYSHDHVRFEQLCRPLAKQLKTLAAGVHVGNVPIPIPWYIVSTLDDDSKR